MKKVLALAAFAEAGTGVILLLYPPVVVRLLFGAEISGAGAIMSRLAGIALIGLGAACWPAFQPVSGMLAYSTLAMLYLIVVGASGGGVGPLLWAGAGVHAIIIVLLVGAWWKQRKSPSHIGAHL